MLAEQRLEEILRRLRMHGTLAVDDVAQDFRVSVDTVGRDFNRLAGREGIKRTHGGIFLEKRERDSTNAERELQASAEKRAIARAAAAMVHDDETIVVDAGTTTALMVDAIEAHDVTLITYSVDVASRALHNPNLTVYIAGGLVRPSTASAVGDDTVRMIRSLAASTAFVGANGMSLEHGVMTPNYHEAAVKRAIMDISQRRVLLADSTKTERRALARFAEITDFDVLVSDTGLTDSHALRDAIGELILVEPAP